MDIGKEKLIKKIRKEIKKIELNTICINLLKKTIENYKKNKR